MIVFDASTLILLAKTDLLDMFVSNYRGQVFIPEKVEEEVLEENCPEKPLMAGLIEAGKIKVQKAGDKTLVLSLVRDFNIDFGEAEAIALALHKGRAVVATDDRNAIRACRFLKLDFITAISILVRAVEKKLLTKTEAVLKLEKLENVGRYKKTIIADARRQIEGGD